MYCQDLDRIKDHIEKCGIFIPQWQFWHFPSQCCPEFSHSKRLGTLYAPDDTLWIPKHIHEYRRAVSMKEAVVTRTKIQLCSYCSNSIQYASDEVFDRLEQIVNITYDNIFPRLQFLYCEFLCDVSQPQMNNDFIWVGCKFLQIGSITRECLQPRSFHCRWHKFKTGKAPAHLTLINCFFSRGAFSNVLVDGVVCNDEKET